MMTTCVGCGRAFERAPSKVGPVNYCGRACAGRARRRRVLIMCARCGAGKWRQAASLRHPPPYYCTTRCAVLSRARKGFVARTGELPDRPSIDDAARRFVAAAEAVSDTDTGTASLAALTERDAAYHDLLLACDRPCHCEPGTCPTGGTTT